MAIDNKAGGSKQGSYSVAIAMTPAQTSRLSILTEFLNGAGGNHNTPNGFGLYIEPFQPEVKRCFHSMTRPPKKSRAIPVLLTTTNI